MVLTYTHLLSVIFAALAASSVIAAPRQVYSGSAAIAQFSFLNTSPLYKRNYRATHYDVGLGACGHYNSNHEMVVALNGPQFGDIPGQSDWCGKCIIIYYGSSAPIRARIVDKCPGCPYGSLDLSPTLFKKFAPLSVGVINVSWHVATCADETDSHLVLNSEPVVDKWPDTESSCPQVFDDYNDNDEHAEPESVVQVPDPTHFHHNSVELPVTNDDNAHWEPIEEQQPLPDVDDVELGSWLFAEEPVTADVQQHPVDIDSVITDDKDSASQMAISQSDQASKSISVSPDAKTVESLVLDKTKPVISDFPPENDNGEIPSQPATIGSTKSISNKLSNLYPPEGPAPEPAVLEAAREHVATNVAAVNFFQELFQLIVSQLHEKHQATSVDQHDNPVPLQGTLQFNAKID